MVNQRKRVPVDKLVAWAWDELAKRTTSSADGMESNWGDILDYGRRGGVDVMSHASAQRYPHFGTPHPDALAVEEAVLALEPVAIDWDAQAPDLMGDLIGLFRGAMARKDDWSRSLDVRYSPATIIAHHANMRRVPDWGDVGMRCERIIGRGGVQLDGPRHVPRADWCHGVVKPRGWKAGDPLPPPYYIQGVACPLEWHPSPVGVAMDRAEYAVWHQALCGLADAVRLRDHVPGPPDAPARPWRGAEARPVHEVGFASGRPLPLKPARPWAAPLGKRRIGSAVPRK